MQILSEIKETFCLIHKFIYKEIPLEKATNTGHVAPKHGKKRSIAGTAQHSTKYSTCKTSAGVNKKFLHFYKRNPFKFFLKSPSIFKRNPIKKNRLQFYMENPL